VQSALAALGASVAAGLTVGLLAAPLFVSRTVPSAIETGRCASAVLDWLTAGNPAATRVHSGPGAAGTPLDVDLRGPHWDLIVVQIADPDAHPEPRVARRMLERCQAGLRPGGRLVLPWPAAGLLAPALAAWPGAREAAHVRVQCPQGAFTAAMFGPDAESWLASRPAPDDWTVVVSPLR
jgi:hypothetical protein